jgi:hypothetical protein
MSNRVAHILHIKCVTSGYGADHDIFHHNGLP